MSMLIHRNQYSKTHTYLTYGLVSIFNECNILNVHNQIYDLYHALNPTNIFLQIEEYTSEIHSFLLDPSIFIDNIFISIDNSPANYPQYLDIIQKIDNSKFKFICPKDLAETISDIQATIIPYSNIFNNGVSIRKSEIIRNDKILCLLSSDPESINMVKDYLYPKTNKKIVLINNPGVDNDQNIGLMLNSDLNIAFNTYGAAIDLTESYDAEMSICKIPNYKKNNGSYNLEDPPSLSNISTMEISSFINLLGLNGKKMGYSQQLTT